MEDETVNIITDGSDTEIEETQSTVEEPAVEEVEEKQVKKKLKLKKSWRVRFTSPTGFQLTEIYCRRCVQYKNPKEFMKSYDTTLDKSGMMSVCRTCCEEIYQDNLRSERDIQRALLKTCRTLNWVYYSPAIDSTIERVKSKSKSSDTPMPFTTAYWNVLIGINNLKFSEIPSFTFTEPAKEDFISSEFVNNEVSQETIDFWGEGYPSEDYRFMEREFSNFRKTHKIETHTEVVLCKEVVYEMLKNKKIRLGGGDVDAKRLESLTKSLGVSPMQTNASQSSKAMDTFSSFIKIIEENTPAEYYQDKKLFKDYDNLEWYFDRFVRRPIKNFFGLSRDFNISEDAKSDDEIEYDDEGKIVEEVMKEANEKLENQ